MIKKPKKSIRKRLLSIILSITAVTVAVGYTIFVAVYTQNERTRDILLAKTISTIIGQDVAKILYLSDISSATDVTTQLKSFKNLDAVILYKKDGTPLFEYFRDNKTHQMKKLDKTLIGKIAVKNNKLEMYDKLSYKETFLVYAKYSFKVETLKEILLDDAPLLLAVLLAMLLFAYLASWYYAKKFTNPILELVKFLKNIRDERFLKKRVYTKEKDEFAILYGEINTMLERMESSYNELKIAAVAFETQSAITITSKEGKILRVNKAFEKITGYKESEVIDKNPSVLKSGKHDREFYEQMYEKLQNDHYWSGDIINRKKDGLLYSENLTIQTVLNNEGEIAYYVASFIDTSKEKEAKEKLEHLEHFDVLTGLINRRFLIKQLDSMAKNRDENRACGFICFDIENFKMINEGYGFEFANKILQTVAQRLEEEFKDVKDIARIGADEFFIHFEFRDKDMDNLNLEMRLVAQRVLEVLGKPFKIEDKTVSISVHCGISTYDAKSCKNPRDIVKETIGAVHIAKESGNTISFYDKSYHQKSLHHLDLYSQMLIAIEKGQFELFYQLQNNQKGDVVGAEALMRYIKDDGEVVPPFYFMSLLEKSGLILKLSAWIADTACKQLSLWQKNKKTKDLTISINVSSKEFEDENFILNIENAIKKYKTAKGSLKVELVESILVEDTQIVLEKMLKLRELGVRISLDDFGTGYSSLSYLKKLPINQIKIDREFIKNIRKSKKDQAIVKSVLQLRDAFDVNVIVEGVEEKEDVEFLNDLGCTLYQGYYFSKPKSIRDIKL